MTAPDKKELAKQRPRRGRWKRRFRWLAVFLVVALALLAYSIKDHVRTLRSLRRVQGTNAYVMDYYVNYNIDEIRTDGIDVDNVEDSFIAAFLPAAIVPIAARLKAAFLSDSIEPMEAGTHGCSTVVLRTSRGKTLFGRNFDWKHNACLILRIHEEDVLSSVAVIDLAYLNLDRTDLDTTNLVERIPLLFAPYYVMDGMNQHGIAVSGMSLDDTEAPYDPAKPDILSSTAMRLILDYARTTEEAIEILRQYNIHFVESTTHLMIADVDGVSAVVEFIDGDLKVTHSDENWQVCTNHRIWGSSEEENDEHCRRYRLASGQLADLDHLADSDDVMAIMKSVSVEDWTMWTSVYNLSSGEFRIAYRRRFENEFSGQLR